MKSRTIRALSKGLLQFVWMTLSLPCTIIRRHADISSERNHSISKYHFSVASIVQQRNMDAPNIKAINFLSSWGFELWQEMRSEANNYQVDHINDDVIHVSRIGVCNPKPRIFSTSNGTPCNCQQKVALYIQECPHETALVANGDFLPHLWNERRWEQRSKLMLSHILQFHRTDGMTTFKYKNVHPMGNPPMMFR